MKKITQNDIAIELGISRRTVARALNNDGGITKETKDQVIEYCNKVGYKKNTISSILAPGNKKNVHAFLIESKNDDYSEETSDGILKAVEQLKEYGVEFTIHKTNINKAQAQVELLDKILRENHVSGIVIIPIDTIQIEKLLKKYHVKNVVTIDKPISNDYSHIGKDYKKSGILSGEMLIKSFNISDKLLIINTTDDNISSSLYYEGFKEQLEVKKINKYKEVFIANLDQNLEEILTQDLSNIEYIFAPRYLKAVINFLKKDYPNIKYVSTGIDDEIIEFLKEDIVVSGINTSYYLHGYLSAKGIFQLIHSHSENFNFISSNEIIIKENLDNMDSQMQIASLFNII